METDQKPSIVVRYGLQTVAVCIMASLLIFLGGFVMTSQWLRNDLTRHSQISAEITRLETRAGELGTKIEGLEKRAAKLEEAKEAAAAAAATAGSLASHTDAAGSDDDNDGVHGDKIGKPDKCPGTGTGVANTKGCELLQIIAGKCKKPQWLEGNTWLFFEGCDLADASQATGIICTWNTGTSKYENCQVRPLGSVP